MRKKSNLESHSDLWSRNWSRSCKYEESLQPYRLSEKRSSYSVQQQQVKLDGTEECCSFHSTSYFQFPTVHTFKSRFAAPLADWDRLSKRKGRSYSRTQNGRHQRVRDPQTLKLDHLQPVQLILSQQFSNFSPFILGGPIPYYPRERKEEAGAENEKKGFTQK